MVAIVPTALLFLATVLTAQACTYCQCRFADNSNCCVYSVSALLSSLYYILKIKNSNWLQDVALGNLDCTEYCAKAYRADGKSNADGTAGTKCVAAGAAEVKYGCIGAITAQGRTPCYVNNN